MFICKLCHYRSNWSVQPLHIEDIVKPVYNDDFYNKIYHLWFIQWCVLMKAEGTNLLLLTISAFRSHQDELQKAEKYPIR